MNATGSRRRRSEGRHERASRHATASSISTASRVSFDGFKALNDLSLYLEPGEMRAIIGPNGAGKTTMMDVITGKTRPDTGSAIFDGRHDLTKLDEAEIANLGIGRKFQKPTVFESHTVADNIRLALAGERSAVVGAVRGAQPDRRRRGSMPCLSGCACSSIANGLAGDLSHGQKQWLEIAMLLAQDPKLLLVDEPVAGMTDAETEETAASACATSAKTHSVVVVEHDMHFVRLLGVKVTCLHEGSVLAEGIDRCRVCERACRRSLSGALTRWKP